MFQKYHAIVNMLYFVVIMWMTMFFYHPIVILISLSAAIWYAAILKGFGMAFKYLLGLLPVCACVIVLNGLFNHQGQTILLYINDNPVTRESLLFGAVSAMMLACMLLWFSAFHVIMTGDKLMACFQYFLPMMCLLFSMVLRFVPRYKNKFEQIRQSQYGIGRGANRRNIWERISNTVSIMSIFMTWAMDNSMETADAMNARGFGLKGRTSYTPQLFTIRDKVMLLFMGTICFILLWSTMRNGMGMQYFPMVKWNQTDMTSVMAYISFGVFAAIPIMIGLREEMLWRYYQSRM